MAPGLDEFDVLLEVVLSLVRVFAYMIRTFPKITGFLTFKLE